MCLALSMHEMRSFELIISFLIMFFCVSIVKTDSLNTPKCSVLVFGIYISKFCLRRHMLYMNVRRKYFPGSVLHKKWRILYRCKFEKDATFCVFSKIYFNSRTLCNLKNALLHFLCAKKYLNLFIFCECHILWLMQHLNFVVGKLFV